jgi:hypothetical protein
MSARAGLSDLITNLRTMCAAGTVDWTDDQIQTVLDRHRAEINNRFVQPVPRVITGGAISYYDYYIGVGNLESGTALAVENGQGQAYGTALYSVDAVRGIVNFPSGTGGSIVAVTGRAYDVNGAAADLWRVKAAAYASSYDFSTDNHRMSRSQLIKNCFNMAALYEEMAPSTNHKIDRDDTTGGYDANEPNLHKQMFGGMHPDE